MDERFERILSPLEPADAAYLRQLVEPPWQRRQRLLDERDDALRDLADQHYAESPERPVTRGDDHE